MLILTVNKGEKDNVILQHVNAVTCDVSLCINIKLSPISFWFSLESLCSVNLAQSLVNIVCILLCQLSEEGPCEDISSDGQSSSFNEWILPAKEFDGMWERFLLLCSSCLSLNYSFLYRIKIIYSALFTILFAAWYMNLV